MKKSTIISVLLLSCAVLVFQAFDVKTTDDNKNVDVPIVNPGFMYRLQNYSTPQPFIVVTDAQGFDNYNMGVNFAETMVSQSPVNPFSIFHNFNIAGPGWWTTDGYNWNYVTVPFPGSAGDPWTCHDSLGNLYCINLNSSVSGTWVCKSTNGGQTWGSAVSGCTGNDRETMQADQTGGPYANYVYCGETPGNFARSTDGGTSFQFTQNMSNTLPGFMMAVGPGPTGISGGSVYVVTSTGTYYIPTYTIYRSTNGGASFTLMSTQNGWVNAVGTLVGGRNSYENMRLRPYPFIYADNSNGLYRGRLYIFYSGNNPGGSGNKPDVYIRYSTDGGASFSSAITINDDPNSTANAQFQEAGWCDKMTGNLVCQWMDTRNCPTADSAEIYASFSSNGGVTWAPNQKISTAKMRINCPTCGGGGSPAYQGDYNGMNSYNGIGVLSWTDFRAGNFGSYCGYYPDYAMKTSTANISNINGNGDSAFVFVTIPAVKSYTGKVKFSATVTPTPANGTITLSFLNKTTLATQDSVTTYPDSVRLRIRTSGGVTQQAYTINVIAHGKIGNTEQTPVHYRPISMSVITGIGITSNEIPDHFYLYQNYPNPFNPATQIRFDIAKAGLVKLSVYDITGKKVADIVNESMEAGKHIANFDASNISSGVYFYRIDAPGFTSIRKMILIK